VQTDVAAMAAADHLLLLDKMAATQYFQQSLHKAVAAADLGEAVVLHKDLIMDTHLVVQVDQVAAAVTVTETAVVVDT
tara:strand:- start:279 stop:512 length:234 start_codon:yes stop_codon:yes gene_type:complete